MRAALLPAVGVALCSVAATARRWSSLPRACPRRCCHWQAVQATHAAAACCSAGAVARTQLVRTQRGVCRCTTMSTGAWRRAPCAWRVSEGGRAGVATCCHVPRRRPADAAACPCPCEQAHHATGSSLRVAWLHARRTPAARQCRLHSQLCPQTPTPTARHPGARIVGNRLHPPLSQNSQPEQPNKLLPLTLRIFMDHSLLEVFTCTGASAPALASAAMRGGLVPSTAAACSCTPTRTVSPTP